MALLAAELERIRYELGFNDLTAGAEPYIGVAAIFDRVIQPYLRAGATTTSSTSVTAASPGALPSPVALTLADATGFAQFARVVVDVDGRQERVTVQSVSGSVINVMLSLAHSGTYPVTVEGGETMVRELLDKCRECHDQIRQSALSAGIKQVDNGDVVFFGGKDGSSRIAMLQALLTFHRSELCKLLFGVGSLGELLSRGRGSVRTEVY